jgi:hypothetical protein
MRGAARIRCHTNWTIHHGGGMHRVVRATVWDGLGRNEGLCGLALSTQWRMRGCKRFA